MQICLVSQRAKDNPLWKPEAMSVCWDCFSFHCSGSVYCPSSWWSIVTLKTYWCLLLKSSWLILLLQLFGLSVGEYVKALECAKAYLLLHPGDEDVLDNVEYYEGLLDDGLDPGSIEAREVRLTFWGEAVHVLWEREKATSTLQCIAAPSTIAKTWKPARYAATGEKDKPCYIYSVVYSIPIEIKEILQFATKWFQLHTIISKPVPKKTKILCSFWYNKIAFIWSTK